MGADKVATKIGDSMLAILGAFAFTPLLSPPPTPFGSTQVSNSPVVQKQVAERANLGQVTRRDKCRVLSDVFDLLDSKYVRDLGSDKLFDNGLKSLLKDLDPHSRYFNSQEAKEFRMGLKDQFGGDRCRLEARDAFRIPRGFRKVFERTRSSSRNSKGRLAR